MSSPVDPPGQNTPADTLLAPLCYITASTSLPNRNELKREEENNNHLHLLHPPTHLHLHLHNFPPSMPTLSLYLLVVLFYNFHIFIDGNSMGLRFGVCWFLFA